MTRSELSAQLASHFSLDKASADRMVAAVFAAIGDSLAKGEAVSIAGFGTFATKSRPARQGRNPRSGREETGGFLHSVARANTRAAPLEPRWWSGGAVAKPAARHPCEDVRRDRPQSRGSRRDEWQ